MNLRRLAEADLRVTLEDSSGFGWPVTLTDPDGNTSSGLYAQSSDIGQVIDPSTGVVVSGRKASAVFRISSLTSQGLALPRGVSDSSSLPWTAVIEDVNGNSFTFKVKFADPDRALGIVACTLELYS